MKLALFLGCNVPTQVYNYEASVRKVAQAFGVNLLDIEDFGCCGELTEAMDHYTSLVFSARNMALAERQGLDLLTLCNGCFASLSKAAFAMKNPQVRGRVNETLKKIGLTYHGKSKTLHFHQLMYDIIGSSKIRDKIALNLDAVSVACHNGCHILRPNDVLGFDDHQNPKKLKELVALTGARVVESVETEQCCGSFLSLYDNDIAQSFAIESIEKKGKVDAVVVGCPFCFKQFDMGQIIARKKFNKESNIPILFYAQLLGLALGFDPKDLGLNVVHKIKTEDFLTKLRGLNG